MDAKTTLISNMGFSKKTTRALLRAGFVTAEDILEQGDLRLSAIRGITPDAEGSIRCALANIFAWAGVDAEEEDETGATVSTEFEEAGPEDSEEDPAAREDDVPCSPASSSCREEDDTPAGNEDLDKNAGTGGPGGGSPNLSEDEARPDRDGNTRVSDLRTKDLPLSSLALSYKALGTLERYGIASAMGIAHASENTILAVSSEVQDPISSMHDALCRVNSGTIISSVKSLCFRPDNEKGFKADAKMLGLSPDAYARFTVGLPYAPKNVIKDSEVEGILKRHVDHADGMVYFDIKDPEYRIICNFANHAGYKIKELTSLYGYVYGPQKKHSKAQREKAQEAAKKSRGEMHPDENAGKLETAGSAACQTGPTVRTSAPPANNYVRDVLEVAAEEKGMSLEEYISSLSREIKSSQPAQVTGSSYPAAADASGGCLAEEREERGA